jgi:hypothetical protein
MTATGISTLNARLMPFAHWSAVSSTSMLAKW